MNAILSAFEQAKHQNTAALVGYLAAGDPDPATSRDIIFSMLSQGLDILELGIPFSDPTADGPAIQAAYQRALSGGARLSSVLELVKDIRKHFKTPIVLFSYLNPILQYGAEKFCMDAAKSGANGLLVVDMPMEESAELLPFIKKSGLTHIPLVAPTTPSERAKKICENATGFTYLVSMTGITGSAGLDVAKASALTQKIRKVSPVPVALGFGISTEADVKTLAPVTDGIVIGSAFVRAIAEGMEKVNKNGGDKKKVAATLGEMTKKFKAACRR
ncbi:tryptophan synthase subunit alpha [Desulfosarcina sp. OttesenSCG-928-A07]|nr:tryptophan synthase subunit alpha [Desulfosarcina sp. OttesenSCG-928-A07]